MQYPIDTTRRLTLKGLSILPFLGFGSFGLNSLARAASQSNCIVASSMTQGPYWIDEKLNRSDLTTNTDRASVLNGLPLELTLQAYYADSSGCSMNPAANVQIDIWHCDAAGEYSDVTSNGQTSTVGQTFLRGYQTSDANGQVVFKTIYPGWYSGRTAHIHVRVRAYDAAGNTTYNFTTQLFFDDTLTDTVYAKAPYNSRGSRDTLNTNDSIYRGTSSPLMVALSANSDGSYSGNVSLGLSELPATLTGGSFNVTTTVTGSTTIPTINSELTVAAADVGSAGFIYVAAELHSDWYFNNGSSWINFTQNVNNGGFPAYFSGVLQANHSIAVLSNIDVSSLGTINLFVGYGLNAQEMLQKQQYKLVQTIN